MSDPELLVELDQVHKRYGDKDALRDLSGTIHAGEVVAAIGPNGGGKSTLLMLIAGLSEPSQGRVTVCGSRAHKLALESAGLVGLVLARPGLYPLLTGWENLRYFAGLFGLEEEETRARAEPLLERLELVKAMDSRLSGWSSGMQQKLSLLRALLLRPRLLLFDEPTANIDPLAARLLYKELRARADEGAGCLLVTHDLQAAETFADRAWLIDGELHATIDLRDNENASGGRLLEAWEQHLG